MLTVTVPPEMAAPLEAEALRLGTTPELLALEAVRKALPAPPTAPTGGSLLDFLAGYIGTVEGSGEPNSLRGMGT